MIEVTLHVATVGLGKGIFEKIGKASDDAVVGKFGRQGGGVDPGS